MMKLSSSSSRSLRFGKSLIRKVKHCFTGYNRGDAVKSVKSVKTCTHYSDTSAEQKRNKQIAEAIQYCKASASIKPELSQPETGALMTNYTSDTKPAEESSGCIALSKNDSYLLPASGGKVSLEAIQYCKASASIKPELSQPATGALMTNYTSDTKPAEESSGCIALSKNDSSLLPASGGKIMTTFMPPPPAATCLAFDPHDNNFCAVGMEDSTIQIYSVRVDEVKAKLKGHQKQITGLAFSQTLDILVSAGADAQLCIWDTEGWEKKIARPIQAPPGHPSPLVGETKVQFHNDQTHLLVVHESQIAVYDSQLGCLQSVVQLLYTNSGVALLALASDTMHKLWKWQRTEHNPSGKSSASIKPELWQPATGALMTNYTSDTKPAEESSGCIALSKNDSYLLSASGGKVSLFNMITFKIMTTFMPPPPAATCLAFDPHDNNFCAVGMEDSTIQIYSVRVDEVKAKLKGHQKQITGLAFSQTLDILVSAGADAQLCIWDTEGWEKKKARPIQAPPGHPSPLVGETKVQFHNDQTHLLVVHESQIAVYDSQLGCLQSWYPRDSLSAPISTAIYSCDGLVVFTGFLDGAIGVFDADNFRLRCWIAPSAYISSSPIASNKGSGFPVVIAAHPFEPNQIALGMSNGAVHVIEPSDAEPEWVGSSMVP